MTDTRIEKLAQVLVKYSLDLQPGDEFCLETSPLAEELSLAVFKEAILAGAHVSVINNLAGAEELFYTFATDLQLDHIPPLRKMVVEQFSARLIIFAPHNSRELTHIDPDRIRRTARARAEMFDTFWRRSAAGVFKWCDTVYPTPALAQEAELSLRDYRNFVFQAGMLDSPDPIAAWNMEEERQKEVTGWLAGKENVHLSGRNIDLRLTIGGRTFGRYNGKLNFPDGEIATSPVEDSVNGWVRFSYPAIYSGKEVEDIELWFEGGQVVKEKAVKGQELLTTLLDSDAGSRYLGEWGIGTNYHIQRFTKNMLFDEKMGGTIHLALGAAIPQSGGKNKSSIHWDMLCDMTDSEIVVDGELFYKNGKFVV